MEIKLYFVSGCHTDSGGAMEETKDARGKWLDVAKGREIFKLAAEGRFSTSIQTGTCEM